MENFDESAEIKDEFYNDSFEKKIVARSAYSRNRHAKWDNEKGENGPVETYHLDSPMSWSCFRSLPDDLMREYVRRCVDRFGVTQKEFARGLFGLDGATVSVVLKERGITNMFAVGAKMTEQQKDTFRDWCGGNIKSQENKTEESRDSAEKLQFYGADIPCMKAMTVTMCGNVTAKDVVSSVAVFLSGRNDVRVTITVEDVSANIDKRSAGF